MKKIYTAIFLTLMVPSIWAKHQITYEISVLGNLVYQLDCMAQPSMFRCSQNDFMELWQTEIKPNSKDAVMLERWKSSRKILDKTIDYVALDNVKMATSPNFPVNANNGINVLNQARLMAFATTDIETYRHRLKFLLSIDQVNEEKAILEHFLPRFSVWFDQQKKGLREFVNDAEMLSKKHDVDGLLTAMRTFYQSELPENLTLPVYLIAHPKQSAATSGLVFNENSLIEVLKNEKAKDRLAVVIHEISHFYHERSSMAEHMHWMNFFLSENSKIGKVGYYLFNEAIATAIGNGLFEKRMQTPEYFNKYLNYPLSFYYNKGIDQAAKAALDLVSLQFNKRKSIDSDFLSSLDKIWAKTLKEIKDNPEQRLRHVGLIILDKKYNDMINDLMGIIRPSSAQINTFSDISNEEPLVIEQYPKLDTIIIASDWQQVNALNLSDIDINIQKTESMKVLNTDNDVTYIVIVSKNKNFIRDKIEQMMQWPNFVDEI